MVCQGCGAQHFPRTDPAVIMLVVRDDACLLGHSHRFPNVAMYSTLAGFVEPGESLEEAVRREVKEEAGIDVGAVLVPFLPALAVPLLHHAGLPCRGPVATRSTSTTRS